MLHGYQKQLLRWPSFADAIHLLKWWLVDEEMNFLYKRTHTHIDWVKTFIFQRLCGNFNQNADFNDLIFVTQLNC